MSPSDDGAKARAVLGQAIREVRERQGRSVSELAAAIGISQRTITRIEAGDRESDYELIIKLARGFGVRASEIFGRVEELEG